MDKFIRNYFWTINLVTIALCCYLGAKSINTFVGVVLSSDSVQTESVNKKKNSKKTKKVAAKTPERKATHNPFTGESMAPIDPVEAIKDLDLSSKINKNPVDFSDEMECAKTSLQGTLIGTMPASDPQESFALIEGSDKKVKMVEVGQEYQNGVPVLAIVRHKVFLDNNGRQECFIHTEKDEKKKSKTKKTVAKAKDESGGDGVQKVDENTYIIDNGKMNKMLENLNVLATQARIVPSFKNGKSNGFRIYAIKSGSFYQQVGIKNGDVIQRINNMDINSPEKALEIYTKLRTEKRITMDVLRRGSKTSIDYTIQ